MKKLFAKLSLGALLVAFSMAFTPVEAMARTAKATPAKAKATAAKAKAKPATKAT